MRPRAKRADRRDIEVRLLDELRIGQRFHVRLLLDDAGLEQQVGRLRREGLELAGEELLVRGLVLPAQELRPTCRRLRRVCFTSAPMIS